MGSEIISTAKSKMIKALENFQKELTSIRTGRASSSMLDKVNIEYYGEQTPLNQVAVIQIPEARQILIKPYEANLLKEIEKAIIEADLGITPQNDGVTIRLNIPALTEERRKNFIKDVYKIAENYKVIIRNIRRDANADLKKAELREDESRKFEQEIQKNTDETIKQIDLIASKKEKELLTI